MRGPVSRQGQPRDRTGLDWLAHQRSPGRRHADARHTTAGWIWLREAVWLQPIVHAPVVVPTLCLTQLQLLAAHVLAPDHVPHIKLAGADALQRRGGAMCAASRVLRGTGASCCTMLMTQATDSSAAGKAHTRPCPRACPLSLGNAGNFLPAVLPCTPQPDRHRRTRCGIAPHLGVGVGRVGDQRCLQRGGPQVVQHHRLGAVGEVALNAILQSRSCGGGGAAEGKGEAGGASAMGVREAGVVVRAVGVAAAAAALRAGRAGAGCRARSAESSRSLRLPGRTGMIVDKAHHVEPCQLGGIQQRLALQAGQGGQAGRTSQH